MGIQNLYQRAIIIATTKHLEKDQKVPGTELPYVVHLSNVSMEIIIASCNSENFNLEFAIQVALLHDIIEDTSTTVGELEDIFGNDIAHAVLALTKNSLLPKDQQMKDSISRIKVLQYEVWAVKLADRITNLQTPQIYWDIQKMINYQSEAKIILMELKNGNKYLANRLERMIEEYAKYNVVFP
ncbi:MAG TPA: HD domain-containing protein [Saprospiraceae bacterium]|nr:HD domain-containing protein [Saprospiraceae bacterium]